MHSLHKLLPCVLLAALMATATATETSGKLQCDAKYIGPSLDYEFRFISGAMFLLPLKQFRGEKPELYLDLFYSPEEGTPGRAARMADTVTIKQRFPDDIKGKMFLYTAASMGQGNYRVYWVIQDDKGRSCKGTKAIKAALSNKQKSVKLTLDPGVIVDTAIYMFRNEGNIIKPHRSEPRRLKIFISMDIAGRRGRPRRPRLFDVLPHFSTLRQLARSQSFNEFSVIVFSFEDQNVLFRQDYQKSIDFEAMSGILGDLEPDKVNFDQLMKGSEMLFFEDMLESELLENAAPESIVFVGQDKLYGKHLGESVSNRLRARNISAAFFDNSRYAWKGAINSVIRVLKGKEYRLLQPLDLSRGIQQFEKEIGGYDYVKQGVSFTPASQ